MINTEVILERFLTQDIFSEIISAMLENRSGSHVETVDILGNLLGSPTNALKPRDG